MTDPIHNIEAGKKLKQLREEKLLTQRDIEKATGDRWGFSERVQAQMISRIEKGNFDKPPIEALIKIGQVLGLSPDHIAEMYQLWTPTTSPPPIETPATPVEPRLKRALKEIPVLPPDIREETLRWLDFALDQAVAKQRSRDREALQV